MMRSRQATRTSTTVPLVGLTYSLTSPYRLFGAKVFDFFFRAYFEDTGGLVAIRGPAIPAATDTVATPAEPPDNPVDLLAGCGFLSFEELAALAAGLPTLAPGGMSGGGAFNEFC